MKAVMIILAVAASVSTSKVAIHSRSSFLQTVKDRYLIGHVTDRLKASSILLCAQLCLKRRPLCCSINYRDEDGKTICELNDKRLESVGTDSSSFVSMPGFIFAQLLNFERSCQEIQLNDPGATSGVYEIYPVPNADTIEVFCELNIAGGGFSFLPQSLTLRSDAQQIVKSLFTDKRNVLLKLKNRVNGSESYTWIQPHPNYTNIDFGLLVNNYSGYTQPLNDFMMEYIFLGILPKSVANEQTYQGFKSNGDVIQFRNCDENPNSLFAFLPNRNGENSSTYFLGNGCEDTGIAVDWRSTATPITIPPHKMPRTFFFLTEVHFGGCGCYTSSDRWSKYGFNATAIGIR